MEEEVIMGNEADYKADLAKREYMSKLTRDPATGPIIDNVYQDAYDRFSNNRDQFGQNII